MEFGQVKRVSWGCQSNERGENCMIANVAILLIDFLPNILYERSMY